MRQARGVGVRHQAPPATDSAPAATAAAARAAPRAREEAADAVADAMAEALGHTLGERAGPAAAIVAAAQAVAPGEEARAEGERVDEGQAMERIVERRRELAVVARGRQPGGGIEALREQQGGEAAPPPLL